MGGNEPIIEYLSTGANRQTSVADWSSDGLLAFGADSNVAIWNPSDNSPRGIVRLVRGHSDGVKAVAFLPQLDGDDCTYLVTGSDDKSLILFRAVRDGGHEFRPLQVCTSHQGPVNCVTAIRIETAASSGPQWLLATGSADATIKIWKFCDDKLQLVQTIKTAPKFFPLCLSLVYLDQDKQAIALAAAGTKNVVQLFTGGTQSEVPEFEIQATLRGHEEWIRSLSFAKESNKAHSDVLLASASQDKYIRIWRIRQGVAPSVLDIGADLAEDPAIPGNSPSNKAQSFRSADKPFYVSFEALLLGHDDWVYSARWHMHRHGKLQLLSTSADNTLAIWESDPGSGIWVSMVRLGEISREKGATTATGSTGGFWTGLWSPNGQSVACLGRTGSWRRWQYIATEDAWRPCIAVSGHVKAVTGISWSGDGNYLLSTSSDQTTRLHMPWREGNNTWHEMSRPQIHGYDLNCIDSLGSSRFVSGADEKLMRVFGKPKAVSSLLDRLSGMQTSGDAESLPDAANMPVLGLSNKAIDTVGDEEEISAADDRDRDAVDPASVVRKSHLEIDHPPLEESLSRHTLWPEMEKLYGHGYEISCLAASHDGKLIASACKASSTNHAVIRLFETQGWTELRPPLTAHSLTATRLRFSPGDRHLLSVGRDRQWAVFERSRENDQQYVLLQANLKGHTRMILDAAWAPSSAQLVFATAGRDKQVRVWASSTDSAEAKTQFQQVSSIPTEAPATAVDFLPVSVNGRLVLSIGTEAGKLMLVSLSGAGTEVVPTPISDELHLPKSISQLAWRPSNNGAPPRHTLALAGEDSSLRIYSFSEGFLQ